MQITRTQLSVQLAVLLATVCVVLLLIGEPAGAGEPEVPPAEHVVAQGDTLWGIAASHAGDDDDIRTLVKEIKDATGITSSTIQPGQVLQVPSR